MASNVSNVYYYCHRCRSPKESLREGDRCPTCNSDFIEIREANPDVVVNSRAESVETTPNFQTGEFRPPAPSGSRLMDSHSETIIAHPNLQNLLVEHINNRPDQDRTQILPYPVIPNFGMSILGITRRVPLNLPENGLTERELSDLSKIIIQQDDLDKNPQCAICLEEFKLNEEIVKLGCDHYFHKHCIITWLKNNVSCPVCRKSLRETLRTFDGSAPIHLPATLPSHSTSMNSANRRPRDGRQSLSFGFNSSGIMRPVNPLDPRARTRRYTQFTHHPYRSYIPLINVATEPQLSNGGTAPNVNADRIATFTRAALNDQNTTDEEDFIDLRIRMDEVVELIPPEPVIPEDPDEVITIDDE